MLLVIFVETSLVSGPSQLLAFIMQTMGEALVVSRRTSLLEMKWKSIVEQLLHLPTITSNFDRSHGEVPKARAPHGYGAPATNGVMLNVSKLCIA